MDEYEEELALLYRIKAAAGGRWWGPRFAAQVECAGYVCAWCGGRLYPSDRAAHTAHAVGGGKYVHHTPHGRIDCPASAIWARILPALGPEPTADKE